MRNPTNHEPVFRPGARHRSDVSRYPGAPQLQPARTLTTMSSETLHAPRERLSVATLSLHHAIVSLMEELEAVDWYRQRADDSEDEVLRAILLHNMREEMEHAAMVLEWIRRNNA